MSQVEGEMCACFNFYIDPLSPPPARLTPRLLVGGGDKQSLSMMQLKGLA